MTPVTKDLVSDLLSAHWSGEIDIWEFMDFVLANEPGISLDQFRDRLWDHIYYNNPHVRENDTCRLHTYVVVKPNDETT